MVIPNCGITGQDSKVLKDCVMSKNSVFYTIYKGYHTGVDLEATQVYSLYDGVVVKIGKNNLGCSVIVQTGSSFCISYGNLKDVSLREGQSISSGDVLGSVDKKVHVEYYTTKQSSWPVRVGTRTWYKNDTSEILYTKKTEMTSSQFSSLNIHEMSDYPGGVTDELNDEADYILSDNKGE